MRGRENGINIMIIKNKREEDLYSVYDIKEKRTKIEKNKRR